MSQRGKKRHPGITEKRLNNKRFRKTEEAILKAFFEGDNYISLGKMARRAGVARSTVYNHHRAVKEIVPDYKRYVLRSYARAINPLTRRKQTRMRSIFLRVLAFIAAHRSIFLVFARLGDTEVMLAMIDRLREKVRTHARVPRQRFERMFRVYRGEVMAILDEWAENEFAEEEMDWVLKELLYLTDTVGERLDKIGRN